jgi:hypothetical protein
MVNFPLLSQLSNLFKVALYGVAQFYIYIYFRQLLGNTFRNKPHKDSNVEMCSSALIKLAREDERKFPRRSKVFSFCCIGTTAESTE